MAEETKKKEKNIELSKTSQEILDKIEKLSLIEAADLVKAMEEKFGVSAAAPVAVAAAPAAQEGEVAEEKSSFNVELTSFGESKIGVIKAVKDILGLGLKDAKDLVEKAPTIIKEGLDKAAAEEIKKKLEDGGGVVVLK